MNVEIKINELNHNQYCRLIEYLETNEYSEKDGKRNGHSLIRLKGIEESNGNPPIYRGISFISQGLNNGTIELGSNTNNRDKKLDCLQGLLKVIGELGD